MSETNAVVSNVKKPWLFGPGNPGGPGRPPSKIPTFLARLTEVDDDAERARLIESGMRNPVIAAKLRALASDNEALSNLASEQLMDRVFGKAKQSIEHSGGIQLEAVVFGDALPDEDEPDGAA